MDFGQQIAQALSAHIDMPVEQIRPLLEVPPRSDMGDYALPCFKLAKRLRMAPPAIATQLAAQLTPPPACVQRIETQGGYLNFYIDPQTRAQAILTEIAAAKERYGATDQGEGKTICLDYSSVNIAKPFHIGHLSTTAIGNSLYKIFSYLGYRCVSINFLGDWGTQFGAQIVAFKKWGSREAVEQGGVHELVKLYVRFHDEAERIPALKDEARQWFKAIEDGDPEAVELFNWFKEITLAETQRIYDMLGVQFDDWRGEAYYNDKMQPVLDELKAKNLLVESNGAQIVDLEAWKMPPCLFVKSDGATLYATRDIAAAMLRKQEYDFDQSLYVVAYQQSLHFAQWFKVVELMGYPWAGDLHHVSYGMVSMQDGAMSTRRGKVIWLEDVITRAKEKAYETICEKSPDLPDKHDVARQVGLGAMLFGVLSNNRIKDIVFSWEHALSFDGETAPYIQYTHARACSVLAKVTTAPDAPPDWAVLANPHAQELLQALGAFPDAVQEAAQRYEPYVISRQLIAIARSFNRYYYEHRILEGEPGAQAAKLMLVEAVRDVLKSGLALLGIEAPQRM